MDIVILKCDFNDRYGNNSKCIEFSIQDNFINTIIEEKNWIIRATCLLSGKPLISSDTLFNSYSDIISFQEMERVEIHPSDIS